MRRGARTCAALAVLAVLCATQSARGAFFAPKVVQPTRTEVLRSHGSSTLYAVHAEGYEQPILLLNASGTTRYDIGYAYGKLLGKESWDNYNALMSSVIPNSLFRTLLGLFLDFQWATYMELNTPVEFLQELNGVEAGGRDAGFPDVGRAVRRGVVLANVATGAVEFDVETLVHNEWCNFIDKLLPGICGNAGAVSRLSAELLRAWKPLMKRHCSMMGMWGSRTGTGELFTGRNLDWEAQTGVAANKLVLVVHPPAVEQRHAHATVGFAGIWGALAGMSAAGVTVHEAGLDNKEETLRGFPWVLRLRYVMERSRRWNESLALWEQTHNTLGINHGVGNAADRVFHVMETKASYTAYFGAGDAREASNQYGAPVEEAVWRTNHGYDPEVVRTGHGIDAHPGDSLTRYQLIHDTIVGYERAGVRIGLQQAVNVTAVPGDKGGSSRDSFLSCAAATGGANILSTTFAPEQQLMAVAFEDGKGASHVPAACGSYVVLDMAPYFASR